MKRVENKGKSVRYLVRCECGRSDDFCVDASHLRSGSTTECKICQYEKISLKQIKDLFGKTFGKLLVLERATDYVSKNGKYRKIRWICKCLCGKTEQFPVLGNDLVSGKTQRCKKCRYENQSLMTTEDLIGKVFGQLTVISRASDYVSPKNRKVPSWECICSCGRNNSFIARGYALKSGKVSSCSKCGMERGAKKTESKIASEVKKYLVRNYFNVDTEHKVIKNTETQYWLKCDVYVPYGEIPEINGFYIEIHGGQHYKFTPFWHKTEEDFKKQREKDKLKKSFAEKNGVYIEVNLQKVKSTEEAIQYIEDIMGGTLSKL